MAGGGRDVYASPLLPPQPFSLVNANGFRRVHDLICDYDVYKIRYIYIYNKCKISVQIRVVDAAATTYTYVYSTGSLDIFPFIFSFLLTRRTP